MGWFSYHWQSSLQQLARLGSAETAASITMNVAFMALFLAIFFFTIGARIEREVVQADAKELVTVLARDVPLLPAAAQQTIHRSIEAIPKPNPAAAASAADLATEAFNQTILAKAYGLAAAAFAVGVAIALLFWTASFLIEGRGFFHKFSLLNVILDNIGLIAVIFVTELVFAVLIIKNFRALDPNFAALQAVQEIKLAAQSCGPVQPAGVVTALGLATAQAAESTAARRAAGAAGAVVAR